MSWLIEGNESHKRPGFSRVKTTAGVLEELADAEERADAMVCVLEDVVERGTLVPKGVGLLRAFAWWRKLCTS